MKPDEYDTLSQMIKYYREYEKGYTQLQLAEAANCSEDSVKKWEKGDRTPKACNINAIFADDSDYRIAALALREKYAREKKAEKAKKEEDITEPAPDSPEDSPVSDEPEDITIPSYMEDINIDNTGYLSVNPVSGRTALSELEYNMRRYSESAYISSLGLSDKEAVMIEKAIRLIFNNADASVFRYAVPYAMSKYIKTKDGVMLTALYRRSQPDGMPVGSEAVRAAVEDILDSYLQCLSNETYYDSICSIVRTYKHNRALEAKYHFTNDQPEKTLTLEEYREKLTDYLPDFSRYYKVFFYKPEIKLTVRKIYRVCRMIRTSCKASPYAPALVICDPCDEGMLIDYGIPTEHYSDVVSDSDLIRSFPEFRAWLDNSRDNLYFPEKYGDILDRLIKKEEIHEKSDVCVRKGLLGRKRRISVRWCRIGLALRDEGTRFTAWYEETFGTENTDTEQHTDTGTLQATANAGTYPLAERNKNMENQTDAHTGRSEFDLFCKNYKNTHGELPFGDTGKFNKKYAYPVGKKGYSEPVTEEDDGCGNMILGRNLRLSLDIRKTYLDENILVIGTAGSGKSRFYIKPNILQANANYIINDPSGELYRDTGAFLRSKGYTVSLLDPEHPESSCGYNPFAYFGVESDVTAVVNSIISAGTAQSGGQGDPFFTHAASSLLYALFLYVWKKMPEQDRSIFTVASCLNRVLDADGKESEFDRLFNEWEKEEPKEAAISHYNAFRLSSRKTAMSVVMIARTWIMPYITENMRKIAEKDTFNADAFSENKKQALFITSASGAFTSIVLYQLAGQITCERTHRLTNGKIAIPVHMIMDEFGSIRPVPAMPEILATCRKVNIRWSLVASSINQIRTAYGEDAGTVIGNCCLKLYYGSVIYDDIKWISEMIGCVTITDHTLNNRMRGKKNTATKYTLTPEEIRMLSRGRCLIVGDGHQVLCDKKFRLEEHPDYPEYSRILLATLS